MLRRQSALASGITAALVLATLTTTILPWARSGERTRNSYALVDSASATGVVPDAWDRWLELWFLVPLFGGVIMLTLMLGARSWHGPLVSTLGAAVVVYAVQIDRSPLVMLGAARVGLVVGAITVVWGVVLLAIGSIHQAQRSRTP